MRGEREREKKTLSEGVLTMSCVAFSQVRQRWCLEADKVALVTLISEGKSKHGAKVIHPTESSTNKSPHRFFCLIMKGDSLASKGKFYYAPLHFTEPK